ncbi:hypothetical protein [Vreelandella sulfidaeris]
MKIKTIVLIAGLTLSTAAAGFAIHNDRYKAYIDPHGAQCWNAAK